jgi:DNA-binding IclR family transcriptional regulator
MCGSKGFHACVCAAKGPQGIPKHELAARLGMTNKKAFKLLAAFAKRYGMLESEQQRGRMQMKARLPLSSLPPPEAPWHSL